MGATKTNPGACLNHYSSKGTLDATLASIGEFEVKAVKLQANGKIVVAGEINFVDGDFKI